ncbi:phosphopantetheine-binding protein [Amycolatopsis speibonae]|uniref:Phosphopantetheine-binding protein n=1 Tax=Amycolatopsis speibonae TaxID=1450224 RepID=A0ABV7P3Q9_9PSEU
MTADRRLVVAAVVTGTPGDVIRSHGATLLPAHMLPERVAVVESLPLTANGKVDRAAIATLARLEDQDDSSAPTGAAETAVAEILAEVLGLDHVGWDQSFFTLGGDSLRATRFITELRTRLGVTLTLSALFAAPTVEGVARAVSAQITLDAVMEEGMV